MKLDFPWHADGKYHQYCISCHAETVQRAYEDPRTYYRCSTCGQRHERSIVIDPGLTWWIADDGEYWHESAGVFVRDPELKFLFFQRTLFPFALTVPAGHVDTGEEPGAAASRELREEVGITGEPREIGRDEIVGDSCRRGSDAHLWHAYLLVLNDSTEVEVIEKDEGHRPVWLTLDEALREELTVPVRHAINTLSDELLGQARSTGSSPVTP